MKSLQPFQPIDTPIEIRGKISQSGDEIVLHFTLRDPQRRILDTLKPAVWNEGDLQRTDGLWQTTCFEAFWSSRGQKTYWEFNASPNKPLWNLYYFKDYRHPQPPELSQDFKLVKMEVTTDSLICRLQGLKIAEIEASLCAVIKTNRGIYYFSTQHSGSKPDFHLRESLTAESAG